MSKPFIIPKEKLAAYRRWEAVSFDKEEEDWEPPVEAPETVSETPVDAAASTPNEVMDSPRASEGSQATDADTSPSPEDAPSPSTEAPREEAPTGEVSVSEEEMPPEAPLAFPTAAEIERTYAEARQQGYSTGHEEGHQAGHEAGYSAGYDEGAAAVKETAAHMETLMAAFRQALSELDQRIAEQLLATAVHIADQVIRQSLRLKPELLLPVAIEAIDALYPRRGAPILTVHPDDAPILREQLNGMPEIQGWQITENAAMTRGGCRVESGAAEIDATLETRWRRVIESLGIDKAWLDNQP